MVISSTILRAAHHSAGMRGRLIEAHRLLRADPGAVPKVIAARKAGDPRAETVVTVATLLATGGEVSEGDTISAIYRRIAHCAGCSDATVISCVAFIVRVLGGVE